MNKMKKSNIFIESLLSRLAEYESEVEKIEKSDKETTKLLKKQIRKIKRDLSFFGIKNL
jgi:predicted transcriptional regulator